MQTFLPVASFEECAALLDYRRLGKQRCEALQILNALQGKNGWSHHPAVKMWRGYEIALHLYKDCMIREWIDRGYKNNMELTGPRMLSRAELPWWLGLEELHASHRGRLLFKDPEWYGQFGWSEQPIPTEVGYYWPV
jgi:hypothetical protein